MTKLVELLPSPEGEVRAGALAVLDGLGVASVGYVCKGRSTGMDTAYRVRVVEALGALAPVSRTTVVLALTDAATDKETVRGGMGVVGLAPRSPQHALVASETIRPEFAPKKVDTLGSGKPQTGVRRRPGSIGENGFGRSHRRTLVYEKRRRFVALVVLDSGLGVEQADAGLFQRRDAGRQVIHFQDEPIPLARFLSTAVVRGPLPACQTILCRLISGVNIGV